MLKLRAKDFIYLLLFAIPNTLLSFGIIYIINNVLAGNPSFSKDYMGIVFISTIIYTYLLNIVFQKELNRFSFNLLYENEKNIFKQILKASLIKLEQYGPQRFYNVVEDLRTFSILPYTVTHTINSLLMILLCLGYMFTLSFMSALIVIGLIILVGASYFIVLSTMSKKVNELRDYNEEYYKYVDDVINGFKELKTSFFRRENLMNKFMIPNRDKSKDLDFKVNYVFLSINLISQYGLYFVVAVILFILPSYGLLSTADVISYVVIILFISGPINNIINLQQIYTRFIVANSRIKEFISDFEVVDDAYHTNLVPNDDFEKITFNDVCFAYDNGKEELSTFALGPIKLEINKGEVLFIVGGNGSGKSTFINLLTGLYVPSKGEMVLNENDTEEVSNKMQNLISVVFTDNHLFSQNYDEYKLENNKSYSELLKTMKLDQVITDDKDETIRRKFSKGQSKRMSLIFALLEEKPIIVLDEWAADQDPYFRKYFYEELIPLFKSAGKTIVAVTHDDAYFHLADRIVKFDYGNIIRDIKIKPDMKELNEKVWS